jgi:hypothetical protein
MRKSYLAAAVAVGTLVFVAGFIANGLSQQGQRDQLGVGGYAIIKAYHSDGTLFSSWQGHNFLLTKGAIAACISGQTSVLTGSIYASCSAFTGKIYALACEGSSPTCTTADAFVSTAADTLQPPTCASAFNFDTCNQWQAQVTFDSQITTQMTVVLIGTFPASSGLTSCTACAGSGGNFPFSGTFDFFSKFTTPPLSPITLSSGDRLIITIAFTVP